MTSTCLMTSMRLRRTVAGVDNDEYIEDRDGKLLLFRTSKAESAERLKKHAKYILRLRYMSHPGKACFWG